MHYIHTQKYPDYMRDLVLMTATLPLELDFVLPVASHTGNQGSERSSVNVLLAFPDLLRGTPYLSTCRQLLTLTLSSVYLKLTYLLPLINYFVVYRFYRWCINDYVMSAGLLCKWTQNFIVCMYVIGDVIITFMLIYTPFDDGLPYMRIPGWFESTGTGTDGSLEHVRVIR